VVKRWCSGYKKLNRHHILADLAYAGTYRHMATYTGTLQDRICAMVAYASKGLVTRAELSSRAGCQINKPAHINKCWISVSVPSCPIIGPHIVGYASVWSVSIDYHMLACAGISSDVAGMQPYGDICTLCRAYPAQEKPGYASRWQRVHAYVEIDNIILMQLRN
jgi:hypothetical protein